MLFLLFLTDIIIFVFLSRVLKHAKEKEETFLSSLNLINRLFSRELCSVRPIKWGVII